MNGFEKYINKHQVSKGENFVLLAGGRLNIFDKPEFFQKYLESFPSFSEKINARGIVFKVPREKLYPLILDIDVDLSREVALDEGLYIKLANYILDEFTNVTKATDGVEVVLSRRPGSCYKKKKGLYRAGFHMYILGKFTLQQSVALREQVLKNIDIKGHFTDAWGEAVISKSSEKILDPALSKRSNGVLLLGCRKPQTTVRDIFYLLFYFVLTNQSYF